MTDLESPAASNGKKHFLILVNDAPYGNERPCNALRLALNLTKRAEASVRVFFVGDGVFCARKGQKTPNGYYNVETMVKSIARRGEVAT
ncbi:MAG: DsrE family protein [Chloroflexota bacterium]